MYKFIGGSLFGATLGCLTTALVLSGLAQTTAERVRRLPMDSALLKRMDELEVKLVAKAKPNCFVVDKFDIAIYPIENLGKHRVEKPELVRN
jgi:hypothetical protein